MKGEQVVQMARQPDGTGGTTMDFASDYPGVMIVLVSFLIGVCWYLLKKKGKR